MQQVGTGQPGSVHSDDDLASGLAWRLLYTRVLELDHASADVRPLLDAWLRKHPRHIDEVRAAGAPGKHAELLDARGSDSYSTSQRLYALSRVLDLLLLGHQPPDPPTPPTQPDGVPASHAIPQPGAFALFCEGLGATPMATRGFHPFFHEIVEVEQAADPDQPPTIVEQRWPGYLLDALVLARAGVAVRAGARHLVRGVADRSVLYWTFRRRARPTTDLSAGWGTNSQWTTTFRRDYVVDGWLHYNVDAALAPDDEPTGLGEEALIQLLRHRCSTVVDHGGELFPYGTQHVERAP